MSVVAEFKEFALKGNVVDLAVGVIIGGAFGKIVSSLVEDIVMPPIGYLLGGVSFDNLYLSLAGDYQSLQAAVDAGAPVIKYGKFIQTSIHFFIVAVCIFLVIRSMNQLMNIKKD
jgi:large conductance mechanosensitive channel